MPKPDHDHTGDVGRGITLVDACSLLAEQYDSTHRTWASYGDFDRIKLMQQCEEWGVPYPFGRSHINVKNLFALQQGFSQEVDLKKATALLGIPFEGTLHRGVDDAWNIAEVLNRVLFKRSSEGNLTG